MKLNTLMIAGLMLLPAMAFAHGTKIGMTKEGVESAIDQFQKDLPARVSDFAAVKAWPDGDAIMVKFTMINGQTTDFVSYHCMENEHPDGSETWDCHKM